jgi:hypothetical protein
MSRWSDAFHALTSPLTHETHVDTCTDAESRTDLIDVAHVSSSVPQIRRGHYMGRRRSATAIMCHHLSHVSGRWVGRVTHGLAGA